MKFRADGHSSRKHVLVWREQLGTDVLLRSELAGRSARPRLWGQEVTDRRLIPEPPPRRFEGGREFLGKDNAASALTWGPGPSGSAKNEWGLSEAS